ncbi:MAG: hypothetical protein M3R65_05325 [Gemmatimonadota bacterium]|nr:hypothetical protein [Gemmatimonadota bacterium]
MKHPQFSTLLTLNVLSGLAGLLYFTAATPAPLRAQPTQADSAAVVRGAADYLRVTYGPKWVVFPGQSCVQGVEQLCADSATEAAHRHASAAASGFPESRPELEQKVCVHRMCRYTDIDGTVTFGLIRFSGTDAIVPVRMFVQHKHDPIGHYEEGDITLRRIGGVWVAYRYQLTEIT